MAESLDDGAFWLPSQFLIDEDPAMDFKRNFSASKHFDTSGDGSFGWENDCVSYFPNEHPSTLGSIGLHSDLSSPVESVVSSIDAESDEEDYIACLTRKMAHSTLQGDMWKVDPGFAYDNAKSRVVSGSPQSTLCTILGGCGCKRGSSRGSPNCTSLVSSPPGMNHRDSARDLLYAAASEVARMKILEERNGFSLSRGLSLPVSQTSTTAGYNSSQNQISYQQLQATMFQQLRQQQLMKQQSSGAWGQPLIDPVLHQPHPQSFNVLQNRARTVGGRPVSLSMSARPTVQQSQLQQQQSQPGSGMRAVFLGNPVSKRECAGTGVFLPRRVGTASETNKKPGCSTVLLPDRVVQALNLNLEAMDANPRHRSKGSFGAGHDNFLKNRNNIPVGHHRLNSIRPVPGIKGNEVRLPPEWTY